MKVGTRIKFEGRTGHVICFNREEEMLVAVFDDGWGSFRIKNHSFGSWMSVDNYEVPEEQHWHYYEGKAGKWLYLNDVEYEHDYFEEV